MNPDRLVVVALGSNLGDSAVILKSAFDRLRTLAVDFFEASSLWRSTPVDCPPGSPDFLNAVAVFEVAEEMEPLALLRTLKEWEVEFGRQPKRVMNEARPLDLDLIGFGCETMQTEELTLPHPRAHERAFVLGPLAEVMPGLLLPGWADTAETLFSGMKGDGPAVNV